MQLAVCFIPCHFSEQSYCSAAWIIGLRKIDSSKPTQRPQRRQASTPHLSSPLNKGLRVSYATGTQENANDDGRSCASNPPKSTSSLTASPCHLPLLLRTATGIRPERPTAPKSSRTWLTRLWPNAENKPREIHSAKTETPTFRRAIQTYGGPNYNRFADH